MTTVLDVHHCSARRSIKVTVANTEAAEAAFLAWYARRDAELKGARSYGDLAVGVWGRDDDEMSANLGMPGKALDALLFPQCEHGMDYHLCFGPNHYPTADEERMRGW